MLVDDDARPPVAAQVLQLDVVRPDDDVEAVLVPAVPDRREEDAAINAVRGQDGHERLLEQIAELSGAELAHRASLRSPQPDYATSLSESVTPSARSFFRLWFSICRIRSRVTLNARPTSSSVRGCSPSRP